jgi:hypothetical protein
VRLAGNALCVVEEQNARDAVDRVAGQAVTIMWAPEDGLVLPDEAPPEHDAPEHDGGTPCPAP